MAEAVNVMAARQSVAKALTALDEKSRKVIVLRFFEGLSAEEVGERLGLSAGNVRTIQSRALKTMGNSLEGFDFSEY